MSKSEKTRDLQRQRRRDKTQQDIRGRRAARKNAPVSTLKFNELLDRVDTLEDRVKRCEMLVTVLKETLVRTGRVTEDEIQAVGRLIQREQTVIDLQGMQLSGLAKERMISTLMRRRLHPTDFEHIIGPLPQKDDDEGP